MFCFGYGNIGFCRLVIKSNKKSFIEHYESAFSGGSAGKNLPAMQETWVQSLGWKDPLGKDMTTHSSILA